MPYDVEQGSRPQHHAEELLLLPERRGRDQVGTVHKQPGGPQLPPQRAFSIRFDTAPRVEALGLGGDGTQVRLAGRGDEQLRRG
ncbi:hypothetical protein QA802_15825 [Streptomyces sp. B21-105]|uniref:hypothetical protein n=1 Tax=Streptomyces sp. B21-105 TaxID=3039417 RepID=UPI002FF208FB